MKIGLVREIKAEEFRVGLTPDGVSEYVAHGHTLLVETGAGLGSGFSDDEYVAAGAEIIADRKALFDAAEMIIKVKEPLAEEYDLFHEGQILYTYLHLAADRPQTEALLAKKVIGVAYETVRDANGGLPLLAPLSQIAGRMAVQEGAKYLERPFGGKGILLGGVPGVRKGKVVILGGGVAGSNACRIALGMGADVTILDICTRRLAEIEEIFGNSVQTLYSSRANVKNAIRDADLIIGSVLIPGATTPKLVRSEDVKTMKPGTVMVDIAIDQGGCFETSHVTYHSDPVYTVDGVVHYCVGNMPGAVALSSTMALTNVTTKYGLMIADEGIEAALKRPSVRSGLNCYLGKLTNKAVAEAHQMKYEELDGRAG
ncbi:MAG: alanine dehydrogenase [Victivallales bacterium]|nr:alanine dehydrogenase [Victivallales bacterium]